MPAERTQPPTRQKSCGECAKSKRRCDLQQPACLRCTRQKLACFYPSQPTQNQIRAQQQQPNPTPTSTETTSTDGLFETDNLGMPDLAGADVDLLDFVFNAATTPIDTLGDMLLESTDDVEELPLVKSIYAVGKGFSPSYLSDFVQKRIGYCVDQLKLAPATMVGENQTPWSHPQLYNDYMPRVLQDVHAACALYMSRTETNRVFVARHISDRVHELMNTPMPKPPIEILGRAQALILCQIMSMWSGDVLYHGLTDKGLPHLEVMGDRLVHILRAEVDSDEPLPLYPMATATSAWRAFILRESARRTLVIVFHFIAVCRVLRGELLGCDHSAAAGNVVTFSAHLWKAASALDFVIAWNERNHFVVRDLELDELLDHAMPEDLDTFGRMLTTALRGIDDMKAWFHVKGGEL